jgi:CheY-like chemotaxis protein
MARVLVVEDELNVRLLISFILEQMGWNVVEAQSGVDALDVLGSDEAFDLVITDILMPYVNGIELIEILKREYPHIPILVTSAHAPESIEALEKGADRSLPKPFSKQQLVDSVRALSVAPR